MNQVQSVMSELSAQAVSRARKVRWEDRVARASLDFVVHVAQWVRLESRERVVKSVRVAAREVPDWMGSPELMVNPANRDRQVSRVCQDRQDPLEDRGWMEARVREVKTDNPA